MGGGGRRAAGGVAVVAAGVDHEQVRAGPVGVVLTAVEGDGPDGRLPPELERPGRHLRQQPLGPVRRAGEFLAALDEERQVHVPHQPERHRVHLVIQGEVAGALVGGLELVRPAELREGLVPLLEGTGDRLQQGSGGAGDRRGQRLGAGHQFLLLFGREWLVEGGVEADDGADERLVRRRFLARLRRGGGCRRGKRFHVDERCGRPDQRLERVRREEAVGRRAGGRVNRPPVVPAPLEGVEAVQPAAGPPVRVEMGLRGRQLDLFEERFGPGRGVVAGRVRKDEGGAEAEARDKPGSEARESETHDVILWLPLQRIH